jgi:ParB family chromosome partitioning protein
MIRRPVEVSPVKAILAMRLLVASGLPASTEAVDDVERAFGQDVGDQFGQHQDRHRRLFGGLEHHAVAGGQGRGQLPRRHQQREVPRDDLADHAQRLVIVIGDGVVVDFAQRAFLAADARGEIAEVVDRQRHVGCGRLADRLAVVDGFDHRQHVEVVFHPLRHLEQDVGAIGG